MPTMRCAAESYRSRAGLNTAYGSRNTEYGVRYTQYAVRIAYSVLRMVYCVFLLTACHFPGVVQPTVKIGLVAPFEGRFRYVGYDVIYAVRMAVREANAAGGVGGYSVELVAYDDGADPAMAVQQVRKLAVDPTVVAAVGHFRVGTTSAALPSYAEAGIPLVAPAVLASASAWGEFDHVYRLGPPAEAVAGALLAYHTEGERERGQGWVALVTDGGPLGEALRQQSQASGLQLSPVVLPQDDDWRDEVLASGVKAVLIDADPVMAGEVAAALRAAGWTGVFAGGPELAAADFAAVAGEAAAGAVFLTAWPFPGDEAGFPSESSASGASPDFAVAYQDGSNGVPPGPLAFSAYEATWVLLEALERDIAAHGEPTRDGMAGALAATAREGGLGRITFDSAHAWGGAPLYWYRIETEGVPHLIGSG
jgi:ABC-type branched-subunit amino acid transport system substrate-binding protein